MQNSEFDKAKLVKYLIWTFVLAYLAQIGVGILYRNGPTMMWQLMTSAMMYIPTIGVLLCGGKVKGIGWNPRIRKNIRPFLIAWFGPMILTAVGAVLYFLLFPKHFDLTGSYIALMAGQEAVDQITAQGISMPVAMLVSVAACLTYGNFINTFAGLGEEIGWRGFMYPQLKARFGKRKAWLLGGLIWGAWHWPLIWLIGYEYGDTAGNPIGYFGAPVTGMLVFCVFTVAVGILCDWLYEKSGSIWLPALCHGAINAAFTLPPVLCLTNTGTARLLGPTINGLIGGLPFAVLAVILFLRAGKNEKTVD